MDSDPSTRAEHYGPAARVSGSGGLRIARVAGIPIEIHWSWIISIGILTMFARSFVGQGSSGARSWLPAIGVGAALSLCVLLHELAHCVVARAYGLPVGRVLLFAFGGVSQIGGEAQSPRAEYHVALAGPLASLTLGSVMLGIAATVAPDGHRLHTAWGYVALFNLWVAAFNLVPAFPMDGGRILRSGLWAWMRSRSRATRWAVYAGRGFAAALIGAGAAVLILASVGMQDAPGGVWFMLVGWFLFNASGTAGRLEGDDVPRPPHPSDP